MNRAGPKFSLTQTRSSSERVTPSGAGTLLRMEQTGFRRDQPQYYGGAKMGWPRYFDSLEAVLDRAA